MEIDMLKYRPLPCYFLNTGDMTAYTEEIIDAKVRRLYEDGFGGCILFNTAGGGFDNDRYLTEEWFTVTERFIIAAEKHGLKLFEDAAQAHGAIYHGKKVGALADGAGFSFYPGKVLGAAGDAGAILLDDDGLANKARMFCNHGRSLKYFHEFAGINSRMDTVQAAVLNVKMKYLDKWVAARNCVAKKYIEELSGVEEIDLPKFYPETLDAWHLFVIKTEKRDELREFLANCGIETGIHYPHSLPEQPAFAEHMSYCASYRAVRESKNLLSLPIGEHLGDEDISFVSEKIRKFFS